MASVTMYPFLTQSELILDNDQRIIPGAKIEVFDPVSNNHVNIYTYDSASDQYVIAQNPVYLDNLSRAQNSYFSDRLVLCMLYKYRGDFADPLSDDDTENWQYVRNWLGSFSSKSLDQGELVTGLSGLKAVDPDIGKVTVVGYWTGDDCEARTYVWNPTSVATQDNGYIVKSDNTDTGRWILQFDGEYLPSTYYGVYPGKEANMNALLTFPAAIGSQLTAPGVYFKIGQYTASTVPLVTQKKLLIDAKTYFSRDQIQCPSVTVVGEPTSPICDFYVNDRSCPVHSSWFNTVRGFWMSNSDHLYIDTTNNNQTNKNIATSVSVTNRTIYGHQRLPQTYSAGAQMIFDGCQFVGDSILGSADMVKFLHFDFRDDIFTGASSNLDFVNNVIVRTAGVNTLELANFKNAMGYVKAVAADGQTVLDLAGRQVSSLNAGSSFKTFRNVQAQSLAVNVDDLVTFDNCRIESLSLTCDSLVSEKSVLNFNNEPVFDSAWFRASRIGGGSHAWTDKNKYIYAEDSYIGINFNTVTDNTTDEQSKIFINCVFQNNTSFYVKKLLMRGCQTNNSVIKIYPYKIDNHYWMACDFDQNVFNNTEPIEFTKKKVNQYGVEQEDPDCYEVIVNWKICNNTFLGNDEGLRCRFWHDRTGTNYGKTFIALTSSITSPVNNFIYYGNSGNCPAENLQGWSFRLMTGDTPVNYIYNSNYTYVRGKYVRCATKLWQGASNKTPDQYKRFKTDSMNQNVIQTAVSNYSTKLNAGLLCYHDSYMSTENGDLFKISIGIHEIDGDYFYIAVS